MEVMRDMMKRLKLTVNEEKTSLRIVPDDHVEFLGYSIGRCISAKTGKAYIGTRPSRKSISRIMVRITEQTSTRTLNREAEDVLTGINRTLTGWGNYFNLGSVSKAYRAIDRHTTHRLRRWLTLKHKTGGKGTKRYSDEVLRNEMGLSHLSATTKSLPWAKA